MYHPPADTHLSAGCKTGEVRVTGGYNLPARYVIHTVGPKYNIKYHTASETALHMCYRCVCVCVRHCVRACVNALLSHHHYFQRPQILKVVFLRVFLWLIM